MLVWFYFRGIFDVTPYDPSRDWWLMVGYPDPDDPVAVAEWEENTGKTYPVPDPSAKK